MLDSERSDWWLVLSNGSEGWVPACYLSHVTLSDPSSPPPEPFEDVNGELAALMGQSSLGSSRRDLYTLTFLEGEEPTEEQLSGVCKI